MSDKQLREEIIRLAWEHPGPIRDKLLPLVTKTKRSFQLAGTPQVIDILNVLLRRELTVINQYMVQAEMCANWGYVKLSGSLKAQAISEMKHAETLIERIILLEQIPEVGRLNEVHIGATVPDFLQNNKAAEMEAVQLYNRGVVACLQLGDNGSRVILEGILAQEEVHLDNTQALLDQINQMGLDNFLAEQTEG